MEKLAHQTADDALGIATRTDRFNHRSSPAPAGPFSSCSYAVNRFIIDASTNFPALTPVCRYSRPRRIST